MGSFRWSFRSESFSPLFLCSVCGKDTCRGLRRESCLLSSSNVSISRTSFIFFRVPLPRLRMQSLLLVVYFFVGPLCTFCSTLLCGYFSDSYELSYSCFALCVLHILLFLVCLVSHSSSCHPVLFSFFVSEMHHIVCPNALKEIAFSFQWVYLQELCLPTVSWQLSRICNHSLASKFPYGATTDAW